MFSETDPGEVENVPVLTDPQNWALRSHQELYAAVHNGNDPGQAGQISSDWSRYGTELTEASRTMTSVITASESKWTGAAAEAARDAMKKLGHWVDETARTAVQVGTKVADQGRVMEAARAQMPAPVEFDWNRATAALSQPGTPAFVLASADIAMANASSRAAHEQAVDVMTAMENNSRQIDSSVPAFKPPFNPNTGQVEEPITAVAQSGAAPALGGVDAYTSTRTASAGAVAAPPNVNGGTATGGVGVNQPTAAAGTPSATGAGAGGGDYTPQMPGYNPGGTNVAAAQVPTAPGYHPGASAGSTYTSGACGNGTYTPQMPMVPPAGRNTSGTNHTPQNLKFAPAAPGAGAFGGGAGANGGPVPFSPSAGGGGGGSFGAGGGSAGSMTPGGSAGVQGQPRGGMPMGMTGSAGASAMGAGAGGAPMAPGAGGKGEDDKEHRSASYVMGGDLFEVPGENLPPSVIGALKTKARTRPA